MRRVLILSESGLLAQGIRSLLQSDPGIIIVAMTADLDRAAEILRDEQPEVILVDSTQFRLSLGHGCSTLTLDWMTNVIAVSQNDNLVHVCRIKETSLTEPEDLIAAVTA